MSDTTKPPAINRMDPLWGQCAASIAERTWDGYSHPHPALNDDGVMEKIIATCADFADAMLRERDKRDREERP